ncbi:MAG: FAD-dependent oxidoreductase [Candidatus Hodgkinia cicadicola]
MENNENFNKNSQTNNAIKNYDTVVIGCGHAGLEAILIAQKLGLKTAIITISKKNIGSLSCNPSVGGTGKSHLVCELNCLGGSMGSISDRTALVAQILNASKGRATRSLRIQVDTKLYKLLSMQILLVNKICIINATVLQICRVSTGFKIKLENSNTIITKTLVLTVGTFVRSVCHIGECSLASDKLKNKSNSCIYDFLKTHGVSFKRLKTGTSPRLEKTSIQCINNNDKTNKLKHGFCGKLNQTTLNMTCRQAYTNEKIHSVIKNNAKKSALWIGRLLAKGPRYCVSIEDKVSRFYNKPQKLIMEPEAINSNSVYVNGLSTSIPIEIQLLVLKFIDAFETTKILKAGYAIEYDSICCNDLKPTLECSKIPDVYMAGQINGTTGYEEAGIQGFIAGLNAASKALTRREYTFNKKYSYTGILINDITRNTLCEPYRMLTTRAENRTQLKQYNTVLRLIPYSLSIDILTRYKQFKQTRWVSAVKLFLLKLDSAKIKIISLNEVCFIQNKLSLISNNIWQKLVTLEWRN